MALLEVRDLTVNYPARAGAVPAVRGVDLTLDAGESGCGKSTMATAVLRLLPPGTRTGGSVLLEGEDVLAMRPGRLRAVRWTEAAIVFQGGHACPQPRPPGRRPDRRGHPAARQGERPAGRDPGRGAAGAGRVARPPGAQ